MDRQLGIVGHPVSQSISPAFQQAALDYYGLPIAYHVWPTSPESLADRVSELRQPRYLGANVTVPHKEAVVSHMDRMDSWARAVGAVNTIAREGGHLIGYNTDVRGFIKSLKDEAGFDPHGADVLLLGAGGAARAAAFGLAGEGISALTIANRTLARAESLVEELAALGIKVSAVPFRRDTVAAASARADLIVNSTSVGMSGGNAHGRSPLAADLIPAGALVYDMVYTPSDTPLLTAARAAGARAVGGLWMLVHQGGAAFEIWTGRNAPVDLMYRAALMAVTGTRSEPESSHG